MQGNYEAVIRSTILSRKKLLHSTQRNAATGKMKIRPPNLQGFKHKFLHTVGFRSFLLADDKHDCGSKPPYVLKKKKAKGRRHGRESANISREMGP
ncbi:hypothetical protein MPTK1_1g01460 [Marchantia polymorpha subsp. ruderalis]|uniref:Uncharacterized protein n=2 Tax=Marchantia polymorpha TaxID=3197 RepID=A0AAF6AKD2_MARPO|nr:hypothetical protein MARPO_0029s0101 [Marchantia polymorpha]BBM96902.1 hypothetical protein Mp_1g01460 [Marchantia polymorpha subsp. ruderalis]|eukprot:PTQ42581.1 hypothetical protein MARPO_0029s0101 [Marchantia polymorpha]